MRHSSSWTLVPPGGFSSSNPSPVSAPRQPYPLPSPASSSSPAQAALASRGCRPALPPLPGWPPRGRGAGLRQRRQGREGGAAGGGGAARSAGSRASASARRRGQHGVALHQPPLLPGAALEPAGPLRRGCATDPAQLLRTRERGAGPGRCHLTQGLVPRRLAGPRPGRAAYSVPAGLRRVDGAREAQRCNTGARVGSGRPQDQAPRALQPGGLRAPRRRRRCGCSGDHIVQV